MIDTAEMFKVFMQYREDCIVVPSRSGKHWIHISDKPDRDVPLLDPAMGGHASFAFGLALAQPDKKVVLFDTEGDVLMGLAILPTIAEHLPKNFYHFVLDNECYATTGGQPVPNAQRVSYNAIALGAGYPHAYAYDNLETFAVNIERILRDPGPVLIALKVTPEIQNEPMGRRKRWPTRTPAQVFADLRQELGIGRD